MNYREAHGMYACIAILFNHESPWRKKTFLTRKITRGLTRINESLEAFLFDTITLMTTNMYGPGDNNHPTNTHVLPSLIRRFHEATQANAESGTCWGTGSPLSGFLHVDDLGEACMFAEEHWQPGPDDLQHLKVGTGVDLSIRKMAEQVAAKGYEGEILRETSKPAGTLKKQLDVSRLASLGWRAQIPLAEGLASTLADSATRGSELL